MLTLTHVSKRYGDRLAVDDLDLHVRAGEIFGLLGPNGAGKSTTVHLAVGLLAPDSGSVAINGGGSPTIPAVRATIGVAPQSLALYDLLTGEENISFYGRTYGLRGAALERQTTAVLEMVGLIDRRRDLVQTYSGGMKRRLNLAAALVHEPRLILLDEPTVGVDPQSRNRIFDNVLALRASGAAIVYTTHYMEEAARLCDRIAIMDEGRVLATDTVNGLLDTHGGAPTLVVHSHDGERRVQTREPLAELNRLAAAGPIDGFQVEYPTLEQVFLRLTGRSLRD